MSRLKKDEIWVQASEVERDFQLSHGFYEWVKRNGTGHNTKRVGKLLYVSMALIQQYQNSSRTVAQIPKVQHRPSGWLDRHKASAYLSCSPDHFVKLAREKIPQVRVGATRYYDIEAINQVRLEWSSKKPSAGWVRLKDLPGSRPNILNWLRKHGYPLEYFHVAFHRVACTPFDVAEKWRTRAMSGVPVLSDDQVLQIRAAYQSGENAVVLSRRFGIDRTAIWKAATGRSYKNVVAQ